MASSDENDKVKTIESLQIGEQKWTIRVLVLCKGEEEVSLKGSKYMNLILTCNDIRRYN